MAEEEKTFVEDALKHADRYSRNGRCVGIDFNMDCLSTLAAEIRLLREKVGAMEKVESAARNLHGGDVWHNDEGGECAFCDAWDEDSGEIPQDPDKHKKDCAWAVMGKALAALPAKDGKAGALGEGE